MTSKERLLLAMKHETPDMVPVSPDTSNMIPAKLTGRPFWDIYLYDDPPLWRAYVDAVEEYKFDGYMKYEGNLKLKTDDQRTFKRKITFESGRFFVERLICSTPVGDLCCETVYPHDNPPWETRKWIKDIKKDMGKLRYFFPKIKGCDPSLLREQKRIMGERGIVGVVVRVPGIHDLLKWFDGGLEAASYAYYDYHDLIAEFTSWQKEWAIRFVEMALDSKPDFLDIAGGGMWFLTTPSIFRELTLPAIKKISLMARQADIPTALHACGRQRGLLDILAAETAVDLVNPLEEPSMGDCNLAEIKENLGNTLALMGNVHILLMLNGTPDEVEEAALKCIADAAEDGGFILSTSDQCGRDTPAVNIKSLVKVARTFGCY